MSALKNHDNDQTQNNLGQNEQNSTKLDTAPKANIINNNDNPDQPNSPTTNIQNDNINLNNNQSSPQPENHEPVD